MRGRKPKPLSLLKLTGAFKPSRHGAREQAPAPAPAPLECPRGLTGEAKRAWNRLAPQLSKLGLLSVLDQDLLVAYCLEWALYFDAVAKLASAEGCVTVTSNGNEVQRALVGIKNRALHNCQKIAGEFGFSPSSRMRLHVSVGEPIEDSFDKLVAEAIAAGAKRKA